MNFGQRRPQPGVILEEIRDIEYPLQDSNPVTPTFGHCTRTASVFRQLLLARSPAINGGGAHLASTSQAQRQTQSVVDVGYVGPSQHPGAAYEPLPVDCGDLGDVDHRRPVQPGGSAS